MDSYRTIKALAEGTYSEKRSKFLAFAMPVSSVDEVKLLVADYQKKYYDARHVCYAYMLGAERLEFRANDNGEPSGTAGKPILGQINSNELTNILIIVVRYFGGIKLGIPGLIRAYKTSTADALANAQVVEKVAGENWRLTFDYLSMNAVMKAVKDLSLPQKDQRFDQVCSMEVRVRLSAKEDFFARMADINGCEICKI